MHSLCSPCLRGEMVFGALITTETRRTQRTPWEEKLGLPSNGPLGPSVANIDFGQRYGAAYYLSDAERWSSHI